MFRRLTIDDVECRVAQTGKGSRGPWCSLLIYKDARVDRAILNNTIGSFNWQTEYTTIDGKLFCKLSIRDPQTKQWAAKMEVGTESNTEREKGQVSDALKRAGFAWGIGEELYSAPKIFITLADGEYEEKNGKVQPRIAFRASQMQVHPLSRKMTFLTIEDAKGVERFRWGKFKPACPETEMEKVVARAVKNGTFVQAKKYLCDTYDMSDADIFAFESKCADLDNNNPKNQEI